MTIGDLVTSEPWPWVKYYYYIWNSEIWAIESFAHHAKIPQHIKVGSIHRSIPGDQNSTSLLVNTSEI